MNDVKIKTIGRGYPRINALIDALKIIKKKYGNVPVCDNCYGYIEKVRVEDDGKDKFIVL